MNLLVKPNILKIIKSTYIRMNHLILHILLFTKKSIALTIRVDKRFLMRRI